MIMTATYLEPVVYQLVWAVVAGLRAGWAGPKVAVGRAGPRNGLEIAGRACNILLFEMRAKRIYLHPSYHIGLNWIGSYRYLDSSRHHKSG